MHICRTNDNNKTTYFDKMNERIKINHQPSDFQYFQED